MSAEYKPGLGRSSGDYSVDMDNSQLLDFRTPTITKVSIDGEDHTATVASLVLSQPIDDHHLLKVRIFQISPMDNDQDIDDPSKYSRFLGKSISVNIAPEGEILSDAGQLDFIGLVTKVELESQVTGLNSILVTAQSPSIVMDGSRKNMLFNEKTPSDCIAAVLQSNPLTMGQIDSAGQVQEYCVQYRETDYDFIMRMAGSGGLFAFYDGKEFCAVKASGSSPTELMWHATLGSFSLGLGTSMMNSDGAVWDPSKKEILTGRKKRKDLSGALSGHSTTSAKASESIYGKDKSSFSVREQIPNQSSIDKAILRDTEAAVGSLIECHGISINPSVGVGRCVKICNMGDFDGSYYVTKVTHRLDKGGQYQNEFICCPLDIAYPGIRSNRQTATNLHFTKVLDNVDPDDLGRVKVKVPWGADEETTWARVITPDAGANHGFYAVPDIDDEVLIGYDQGNPDRPIVMGSAFNDTDRPPLTGTDSIADGSNFLKLFRTRSGNEIQFDDTAGKEQIHITQDGGQTSITLTMEPGEPTIIIKSAGKISIQGDGDVAIESGGDLSLKAAGAMSITTDGGDIELDSGGAITGKATSDIELTASANCKIKSSVNADLEGAMVNVKGSGVVKVQGAIIQLN